MIYEIQTSDIGKEWGIMHCPYCDTPHEVDFRDIGFIQQYNVGQRLTKNGGEWISESNVEFKKRKQKLKS